MQCICESIPTNDVIKETQTLINVNYKENKAKPNQRFKPTTQVFKETPNSMRTTPTPNNQSNTTTGKKIIHVKIGQAQNTFPSSCIST